MFVFGSHILLMNNYYWKHIVTRLGMSTSVCTRSPSIIGYSWTRPHGASVSLFEFTLKSAACNNGSILQYQLQYTESCSARLPATILTGNNKTSTTVAIPSCTAMDCYVRVRAELSDGSFTDYSSCALINNQLFMENHSKHNSSICFTVYNCFFNAISNSYAGKILLILEHNTKLVS